MQHQPVHVLLIRLHPERGHQIVRSARFRYYGRTLKVAISDPTARIFDDRIACWMRSWLSQPRSPPAKGSYVQLFCAIICSVVSVSGSSSLLPAFARVDLMNEGRIFKSLSSGPHSARRELPQCECQRRTELFSICFSSLSSSLSSSSLSLSGNVGLTALTRPRTL